MHGIVRIAPLLAQYPGLTLPPLALADRYRRLSARFVHDTGVDTPREHLARAVVALAVAAQFLAVVAFVLR